LEGGLAGFQYPIGEKNGQAVGTVTGFTHADPLVNLIHQALPQAALLDFSDLLLAPLPSWHADVVDLVGGLEYNPPFTKGVLTRPMASFR